MGRWTQSDEDVDRLPEGVKRTGYDAGSGRYTFCDCEGNVYMGPPHEEYGALTLVGKNAGPSSQHVTDRPNAFATEKSNSDSDPPPHVQFHEFLPAHLITSPSFAQSMLPAEPSAGTRLRDAARRATLPTMQNVVHNVRRSKTTPVPTLKPQTEDGEKTRLLRSVSRKLAPSSSKSGEAAPDEYGEKTGLLRGVSRKLAPSSSKSDRAVPDSQSDVAEKDAKH
ncbi:hypothetical protein C8R44DRAFT_893310 [Mycena epipterygia]|nr:hypothetical protein C8R44DRAFT_893310 [Mycena epipterygia]